MQLEIIQEASEDKLALQGCAGSGKTYSALLLAYGIGDWTKIAVIDSENNLLIYMHT